MPVFMETAGANRDLRVQPSYPLPLPRLSPKPETLGVDKYEVVIAGVSQSYNIQFGIG